MRLDERAGRRKRVVWHTKAPALQLREPQSFARTVAAERCVRGRGWGNPQSRPTRNARAHFAGAVCAQPHSHLPAVDCPAPTPRAHGRVQSSHRRPQAKEQRLQQSGSAPSSRLLPKLPHS
eukprot:4534894-Prymnesium_polylepis.3